MEYLNKIIPALGLAIIFAIITLFRTVDRHEIVFNEHIKNSERLNDRQTEFVLDNQKRLIRLEEHNKYKGK